MIVHRKKMRGVLADLLNYLAVSLRQPVNCTVRR